MKEYRCKKCNMKYLTDYGECRECGGELEECGDAKFEF